MIPGAWDTQQFPFELQLWNLGPRAGRGQSLCPPEGVGRAGGGGGGGGLDPNQEARDQWVREEQQAHAAQSAEEERRDRRVDVSPCSASSHGTPRNTTPQAFLLAVRARGKLWATTASQSSAGARTQDDRHHISISREMKTPTSTPGCSAIQGTKTSIRNPTTSL